MASYKRILIGCGVMLAAGSALAQTVDLRVSGTIAPAACAAVFADGGVLDYGSIDPADLNGPGSSGTDLGYHPFGYVISCDAPIALATSWIDGRQSSGWGDFFGLGTQGNTSVGGYRIYNLNNNGGARGDGMPVALIVSVDDGASWASMAGGLQPQKRDGSRLEAYAVPGTLVPAAYETYTGTFAARAFVRGSDHLDMSRRIVLDGTATMVLRYL